MMQVEILRIVVPIATFMLGTLYSIFNNSSQKKLANRCFPHTEEAYLPIDLNKIEIQSGTKMYYAGDYAEIFNDKNTDKSATITYLKLTNSGPGHMLNCNLDIVVSTTDFHNEWSFKVHVPFIKKDEMILIPTLKRDMLNKEVLTKSISVRYLTHSREKMDYSIKLIRINEDSTDIDESLHVMKFKWIKRKIYRYKGKNSLFVYTNIKK